MPTTNWTDKMNTFKALVLNDAREKRDELIDRTENEYKGIIDKKETELLEKAYRDIQGNIHLTQKASNERLLHTELDAKRSLIVRREEIIEETMSAARERLIEFTKSAEYEKWLLSKAEKAFSELGGGEKTVYISENDMRLKDSIEKMADNVTVEASKERGFIGGIEVINHERHIAVNYSIDELLGGEKQRFLRESGLTID